LALARSWFLSIEPITPIILATVGLISVITMFLIRALPIPNVLDQAFLMDMLPGWGAVCLALSLGYVLAASVLRNAGGEIYGPQIFWTTIVPHFRLDLGDNRMMSRLAQAGVWSALFTPMLLVVLAAQIWRPEWAIPPVVAMLYMLRPVGGGSVSKLFSAMCRGHILDTQKDMAFSLNKRWSVQFRLGLARVSLSYVVMRLMWGVLWVLLIAVPVCRATQQDILPMLKNPDYWMEVGRGLGVMVGASFLVLFVWPIARGGWSRGKGLWRDIKKASRRWRPKAVEAFDEERIKQLIAESVLFRRLPPADRAELQRICKVVKFSPFKTLFGFADQPQHVGLIISGRIALFRRLISGRSERVLLMRETDIFGAHALLDQSRMNMMVRTLTPVVAIMFPVDEFKQRVLGRLGVQVTNDLVHKYPFLRDSKICRHWHPQAVARFCQLASTISCEDGAMIVSQRQENNQFYVVYEGNVVIQHNNRMRAKLGYGHFFGEIGLLQNSAAIADVIAYGHMRCLTISKADFLRFMTHNPLVGLQLEAISSRRLGHPIFPLRGGSFDIR
jgi:CRP-like cAMP-binding protein